MADRTVRVRLLAVTDAFRRGMTAAGQSVEAVQKDISTRAKTGKADLESFGRGATVAGGLLLAGFTAAAGASMTFEKQMSSVKAATRESATGMGLLRDAAIQAGKGTAFSATEAAEGIENLSKAGVSTADILRGGLKGALDLAAAGSVGVGFAAETAASAMTQFKLSGKDVPHIADLLAAGAGKAQGEVSDMAMALKQSGPVASQFGLSIEETTGTLAAFASAGLIGSDAGTSFKTMLLALANPAKETKAKWSSSASPPTTPKETSWHHRARRATPNQTRRPRPGHPRPGPRPDLRQRRHPRRQRPLHPRRRRNQRLDHQNQRRRIRLRNRRHQNGQPLR